MVDELFATQDNMCVIHKDVMDIMNNIHRYPIRDETIERWRWLWEHLKYYAAEDEFPPTLENQLDTYYALRYAYEAIDHPQLQLEELTRSMDLQEDWEEWHRDMRYWKAHLGEYLGWV